MSRKRESVAALKQAAAEAEKGSEEEEGLRRRLQLDTGLYKDAVMQLKEIKPQIESLQKQLERSQRAQHDAFEAWRCDELTRVRNMIK